MKCILRPARHTQWCSFCSGDVPAVKHVQWSTSGCANLCRRHLEGVRRSYQRGLHRIFETSELKGQALLPYPAHVPGANGGCRQSSAGLTPKKEGIG